MPETNEQKLEQAAETEKLANPDVLDQLLKPEVQQSLTQLVEQLPKLAEMMDMMTKMYDLAQQVVNDRVLIEDMVGGITDIVKPLGEKAKTYASAMIEAGDRADQSEEQVGLFSMIKLMKDPELQRMLRFSQAYLDILAEKRKQEQE